MTAEKIGIINKLFEKKHELTKQHNSVIEGYNKQIKTLLNDCDHQRPDGRSAINSGLFMKVCTICGWTDL